MKVDFPSDKSLKILSEMREKGVNHPLQYRGFIFDVDGVIFRGKQLIPGADTVIEKLKEAEKKVIFISNNSTKSRRSYREKFLDVGISIREEDLVLSTYVASRYIADKKSNAIVYMIGAQGLREELEEAGLHVTDNPGKANYVVIGSPFDGHGRISDENRWSFTGALRAIYNGEASYVATNPDRIFPAEDGIVPGTGAVIGLLKYITKKEPEAIVGKPSATIIKMALEKLGLKARECVIIGDMDTDMLAGKKTDMTTVFVKTGAGSLSDLRQAGIKPSFTYKTVKQMLEIEENGEKENANVHK